MSQEDFVTERIRAQDRTHQGRRNGLWRSLASDTGRNLALFDLAAAEVISCALYYPKKIDIQFGESDPGYVV